MTAIDSGWLSFRPLAFRFSRDLGQLIDAAVFRFRAGSDASLRHLRLGMVDRLGLLLATLRIVPRYGVESEECQHDPGRDDERGRQRREAQALWEKTP